MLSFQAYLTLGVALMVTAGTLLSFSSRERFRWASWVAGLMIFFPLLYMSFNRRPYVAVSGERVLETHGVVGSILLVSMLVPIALREMSGKMRGYGYLAIGALLGSLAPWSLWDASVFLITMASAAVVLVEGGLIYAHEAREEAKEARCLSVLRGKGEVTVHDVMVALEMTDYEAERVLGRLWEKDLVERVEGKAETYYRVKPPRKLTRQADKPGAPARPAKHLVEP